MATFLDRIENLEEEQKSLADDIKSVWQEAKAAGYNPKIMKRAHSLRKMDKSERVELGVYCDKLGLFD